MNFGVEGRFCTHDSPSPTTTLTSIERPDVPAHNRAHNRSVSTEITAAVLHNLHESPVLGRAATRLGASCVPAKEVIVKACTEASAAKHTATAPFIVLARCQLTKVVRFAFRVGSCQLALRC
jgi:hypothetical protein